MPSFLSRFLLYGLLGCLSCSSQNLWEAAGRINAKGFRSFVLHADKNPQINADIEGVITGTNITLYARRAIDRCGLVPSFSFLGESVLVGSNLQKSGAATNDFEVPLVYSVRAIDGSSLDYLVRVDTNPLPNPFLVGNYVHFYNNSASYGVTEGCVLPYIGVRYEADGDALEFRVAAQYLQGLPGYGESSLAHLGSQNAPGFAQGKDGIAFAMLPELQAWLIADPAHRHGETALWKTRAKLMEKMPDGSFRLVVKRSDLVSANSFWGPLFHGLLTTKVLFTVGTELRTNTTPFYIAPIGLGNCVVPYGDIPGYPAGFFRVIGTMPANNATGVSGMAPIQVFFNRSLVTAGSVFVTEAGAPFWSVSVTHIGNRLLVRPTAPLEDDAGVSVSGYRDADGNLAPDFSFSFQPYRPSLIQSIEVRNYQAQKALDGSGPIDMAMVGKFFHLYGEADFHNLTGGEPDPDWQSKTYLGTIPAGYYPVTHTVSLHFPVLAGRRYWLRLTLDPALAAPPYWGQLGNGAIYLHILSTPVPAAPVKRLILDVAARTAVWTNY